MDNGGSVGTVKTGSSNVSSKKHHRHQHYKGVKGAGLVDYTSEVSSEDFSGPEDGEVDSDSGTRTTSPLTAAKPKVVVPQVEQPKTPPLVANASPINDDEDDLDIGKNFLTSQIRVFRKCKQNIVISRVFLIDFLFVQKFVK